ncbi:hypothetical protein [Belliella aquatica]|uniref:Outer membrane protein beta-barrel domain-containing protein n=1 Tax=Belliella aquatica TaxID=1323734 RepID=A0ABQ1LPP9_9BACT|nr:hypothetical protein [Belliella aquatica]MCH7404242.1 hypothetical protein [Belliella aquatica]GGC26504.1 hypothetical protein GCM10010993_01920 [Belliella aquatica]
MKFKILLPALFLFFSVAHAQEIKIDAGLGLGTTFDNGAFGPGKVLATAALNYRTVSRFDFSLDFLTTGQLSFSERKPIITTANFDMYNSRLANWTNVMFFTRYKFAIKDPRRYAFIGAGLGLSHVSQRVNTNDTRRVYKNNFAAGLEAGLVRNNITLGLRFITPVEAPTFQEINEADGREVVYPEATFIPLMFYVKYDIVRVWKR